MHKLKLNHLKYLINTKSSSSNHHHLPSTNYQLPSTKSAFTIVELLVVIVVIGILAAITVISYTGVSKKAVDASLQSDLTGAKTKLQMYQVEYGSFPTTMTKTGETLCPSAPTVNNEYCIKSSPGNNFTYTRLSPSTYSLDNTNTASSTTYHVTESSTPTIGAYTPPADPNWITIGTQTWAKANLNVGTMVTGATEQTNNATLEKYCYNNLESNCTTYGGLYQWNEAMQYVATEGAQGICPAGSHIPNDAEWTILENFLGSATAGTQLQPGGASGLNIPLAGYRYPDGPFDVLSSDANLWSSSEYGAHAWVRGLNSGYADVDRSTYDKGNGFSVRCLGN